MRNKTVEILKEIYAQAFGVDDYYYDIVNRRVVAIFTVNGNPVRMYTLK